MEDGNMFDVIALKAIMAAKGLSIRELSERSGVNYVSLSRILNAGTTPTIPTIGKLALALGVSPEKLLRRE